MPSVVPRVKTISSALFGVDEFGGARAGGFETGVARLLNSWMPRWTLALSCS
jgi:hypothetical protein